MRKKINAILILIVILALCLCAMVACKPERDADGLLKLKAPQNFEFSGSTLSWDEVDNAQLYYISVESSDDTAVIEGKEESSTTSTSFNLSTIVSGYGDFTVYVRAYGDGKTYGTSDKSKTVYHKGFTLDTPRVTIDTSAKTASWGAVNDAKSYSIRIFDGDSKLLLETTTENTSFSFADYRDSEGEATFEAYDKYRFVITAVPSDYSKFSDSERGTFYYINSTKLATPALSSITSSRIQWGSVTNATSYTLKMTYVAEDGTSEETNVDTTGISYPRSNFSYDKVGTYIFTVKAVGDNEVFIDSDWSEEDDAYAITKIDGVNPDDLSFAYNNDGSARLEWSIGADTKADLFYLTLMGLLPDGSSKLENTATSFTISCNVIFVEGMKYYFYEYNNDNKAQIVDGATILVYNVDGNMKVRYNGADYVVKNSAGEDVRYSSYVKSDGVDIVFDGTDFIYDKDVVVDGEAQDQYVGEDEKVYDLNTGNQLCYFEESSMDFEVEKSVIFNANHEPVEYRFAVNLDDIFIKKEVVVEEGSGKENTTYSWLKSDSNYGILYDVSVSAGNSDDKYVASEDAVADGQYLSYKVVMKNDDGKYYINDAGEYAYIVLQDFVNNQKGSSNAIDYVINKDINFNGYEITQIQDFNGTIDGRYHTLSNMVFGNKQLTLGGVVPVEGNVANYSQFVNILDGSSIDNTFYMGIKFVGYEKPETGDETDGEIADDTAVSEINVAPIAINNYGSIDKIMVQTDSIIADGANVAGMVINNYKEITMSQVYAELEGRNVAGVAINVEPSQVSNGAAIYDTGFYGTLTSKEGEYFDEQPESLMAAGIALNVAENCYIFRCEAVGQIEIAVEHKLNALYAGGLVAINKGTIAESYCGEYTRGANEATIKYVTANGDNGYAGGLVAYNAASGVIQDAYATNRVKASEYVGGFVGRNDGTITRSYALGGTVVGGTNNGAFAGSNAGDISYVAAYSNNTQVRAEAYDNSAMLKDQSDASLESIVEILYRDSNEKLMTMIDADEYPFASRFRYPILVGRTYTKDYVVEMSRNQIDPDVSGIAVIASGQEKGEVKELTIDEDLSEEYIFGDSSAKGNKVVIILNLLDNGSGGNFIKLVYAIIK